MHLSILHHRRIIGDQAEKVLSESQSFFISFHMNSLSFPINTINGFFLTHMTIGSLNLNGVCTITKQAVLPDLQLAAAVLD